MKYFKAHYFPSLLLGLLSTCLTAFPLKAAEKINFVYSPLVISLPVESLEIFVQEGTIDGDLEDYLGRVSPEKREKFRQALGKRIDINPVLASRFFNSAMGSQMLYRLGKGITIEGGINGQYALRGAIVSAAFDQEGLTLLNVLKKFPTNMQLQGEILLEAVQHLEQVVVASEKLVQLMRELTLEETNALKPSTDYSTLPDVRQPGSYSVRKEVWNLRDESRGRDFYVIVHIPTNLPEGKIPVIVFSHGLASRPEDFAKSLEHLASYGFVVAAPQHPGSDALYLQEMLQGYHRNIFDVQDFVNRPLDISYVIDELERRNATEFEGKLTLDRVGVAGHSFGGYTVLALAGAEIDFQNLQQDCDRPYFGLNLSILLECRALELDRQVYNFRDERVGAVFAANPVNRSIFGEQGLSKIAIPVVLGGGSYDPVANPIFEQALPFTWLTTPDKYLVMVEGQAHVNFTELDGGITKTLNQLDKLTLPSQDLIYQYTGALLTSFFETYIIDNISDRPFMRSAYASYLSEGEEFRLNLITPASQDALERGIRELIEKNQ